VSTAKAIDYDAWEDLVLKTLKEVLERKRALGPVAERRKVGFRVPDRG
jgi:hypothetical protein